jgi:hypothetical protein
MFSVHALHQFINITGYIDEFYPGGGGDNGDLKK